LLDRQGKGASEIDGGCDEEFPMSEEKEREWIKGMLDNPSELLLLAEHEGSLLGNISFQIGKRRRLAHAGEFGLGVLKPWRGKGVGEALLKALIDWAKGNPAIEKVDLGVLSYNEPAIRLYEKFGFTQDGCKVRALKYADGSYTDMILMSKFV
jgi:RimJ/RimL family protein N-acetyltransferase